jgi:hypothetical protein
VLRRHQRGEHFNLQRRDVGEEANAVSDAGLVSLQHIKYVAHEVQRALLDAVATEDYLLRFDSIGDG